MKNLYQLDRDSIYTLSEILEHQAKNLYFNLVVLNHNSESGTDQCLRLTILCKRAFDRWDRRSYFPDNVTF